MLTTGILLHSEMFVFNLTQQDIKMTATNDDDYFVFEDLLYQVNRFYQETWNLICVLCLRPCSYINLLQVLLPFTRDTEVLKHFERSSATPPKSYIRGTYRPQDKYYIENLQDNLIIFLLPFSIKQQKLNFRHQINRVYK